MGTWPAVTGPRCGGDQAAVARPGRRACSLLVEYPAGFTCEGGALCADDEFLVLGGALEIDGQRHGELAYAHLPATTREWAAPQGAVVLSSSLANPRG